MNIVDNDLVATKLVHSRISNIKCWNGLLLNCNKLSTFDSRIQKFADVIANNPRASHVYNEYESYKTRLDAANKFKGDVTEIFAEFMIKAYGRTWNIYNYVPLFNETEIEKDVGVDGTGITNDGRIVTVQVKYRNWETELDYKKGKLSTFHWSSIDKYGVDPFSNDQMVIFTLAKTINWHTLDQDFHGKLKFISRTKSGRIINKTHNTPIEIGSLNSLCDNPILWSSFYYMVNNY